MRRHIKGFVHGSLLCMCIGILQGAALAQELWDRPKNDAVKAKQFCEAPAFKSLSCGWATEAEQTATLTQCVLCGTLFRGGPSLLPTELVGHSSYNQIAVKVISLACKGPVVVRSVFKMLQQQPPAEQAPGWAGHVPGMGNDCPSSSLRHVDEDVVGSNAASPVVRCELQLPRGDGSEVERAIKAKEGPCWLCERCRDGKGCPSKTGVWYSDSYTTVARGCDLAPKGYFMHRSGININPATKVQVAKFEVCNQPGCFDPQAEQAKLKSARACIKGKCA